EKRTGRQNGKKYRPLWTNVFWGINVHQSPASDIQVVETLRWSWVHARKGVLLLICLPIWIGLSSGLSSGLIHGLSSLRCRDALFLGLIYVFTFGPICLFFGGLRGSASNFTAVPNVGIKLSMVNAVLAGGVGLLVFGLVFALIYGLIHGLIYGL